MLRKCSLGAFKDAYTLKNIAVWEHFGNRDVRRYKRILKADPIVELETSDRENNNNCS